MDLRLFYIALDEVRQAMAAQTKEGAPRAGHQRVLLPLRRTAERVGLIRTAKSESTTCPGPQRRRRRSGHPHGGVGPQRGGRAASP